jgi:sigma-B regulation protein RsbU (phosphoserine phosphatase)
MIERDGTYIVHPDTTKLFRESIFSDADPEVKRQIDALGLSMIAGRSGMVETKVDGEDAYIFYRPLQRTGWSIAIVCPESDVFARYNRLLVLVWSVIGIGLVFLLILCYQILRRAVQPLSQLDRQAQRIADGHFDETLPESHRRDSVGRLTNSFISMQQSIAESVNAIRSTNEQLSTLNAQLNHAYQLKLQTNRKKTEFIQAMYHAIRTPLNIISGFTQVLNASLHEFPADEIADITARMKQSAADLTRLTRELEEAATSQDTHR